MGKAFVDWGNKLSPYVTSKTLKNYLYGKDKHLWFIVEGYFYFSNVGTSKATVKDARYKVSRIVKLVEIVEIKVDFPFYFYYALLGLYSANFFC